MKRRNFETPTQQGNVTYERKGITSEIVIPLLACVFFGLGVTIALTVIQCGIRDISVEDALRLGGGVGVLVASLAMAWRFYRAVVGIAEKVTRRDLNRDGWIGEPEPRFVYVKGTEQRNSRDDDLADFVRGCYTRGTGRRAWSGARLPTTNHKLSKSRWVRFTFILLKAGLLKRAPGGGTELTCELEEALRVLGLE